MQRWGIWLAVASWGCADPADRDVQPSATDTDTPITDTEDGPIDAPACNVAVADVEVGELPAFLQRQFTVTLTGQADAFVTCTSDDDPDETLVAVSSSTTPTAVHVIDVHGFYADSTWACEVTPLCEGATAYDVEVVLAPPADGVPTFSVTGTPTGTWTLLNSQSLSFFGSSPHFVVVVDPEGRLRWATTVAAAFELDIDATWTGETMHVGGGWGLFDEGEAQRGIARQLDLSGNVLWERDLPAFGLGYNHHSEPMPDGEVLSLTTSRDQGDGSSWFGVAVERIDPATDKVTWSWSSQQLFDDGTVTAQQGSPWHANAMEWRTDGQGDALWVSLYVGQAVWRIDRNTGQRTHVFGAGGDFTLLDTDGNALPAAEWPYAQHDPDFTDDDRILVYDNGVGRPGGSYSRVAEYQLDLDTREATLLWSWTEEGWYTPIVGDADYLPSGNVLITKGVIPGFPPLIGQASALIEVDPSTDTVVWRMDFDDGAAGVFRSQRYEGCDLFRNTKHCDDAANELAELRAAVQ